MYKFEEDKMQTDNQEVEVLTEIKIDEEIFANGKLLIMAYAYDNANGIIHKKEYTAFCMEARGHVYMGSFRGHINFKGLVIISVNANDENSILIYCTLTEPCGEYTLLLKNEAFSNDPMCDKIVEKFDEYYNNSNEYVLK